MKIIQITGTPGTGKTEISKQLKSQLKNFKVRYINIKSFAKKHELYDKYDKKKDCYVIKETKLRKYFLDYIQKLDYDYIIIDSHILFLTKSKLDLVIVLTSDLKILEKRLKNRKYKKNKIKENIECEIFDYCFNECFDKNYKKVLKLRNNTKKQQKENISIIRKEILKL